MNTAALYHRPESEFAYLYSPNKLRIRLATAVGDVTQAYILYGDPYLFDREKWFLKKVPMKKSLSTETNDFWEFETDAPFRRLQYGFCVEDDAGYKAFYCDQGVFPYENQFLENKDVYFRMPYFQEIDRFKAPDWVKETVWYQIFPERFANGDKRNDPPETLSWGSKIPSRTDFFGGDLQGILDYLDYLQELGVNGLYFCPIFKAPTNHKYDTLDYFQVDPHFGDKPLFKKLVEGAHKRGMRIMLDAVFNHIGSSSPEWQDVMKHGENSKYKDWFHIQKFPVSFETTDIAETGTNITYDTFSFNPEMPKWNTANPEVQEHLLAIASYWIEEFDIDAWRLDVANEVDHHFWKKLRHRVDELKPDFYLLGEIWHSSQSWLNGDEFSAVMNYAFTDNIKAYFADKSISALRMVKGMNHQQMLYRDQTNEVTFNLLDSHDTERILTRCQGDKDLTKAILTFMFLQKGSPCIFYGTEVGMEGKNDPDCRRCMIWEEDKQDKEMLAFMKQLIALRKEYSDVITYGDTQWLHLEKDNVLIFQKEYQGKTLTCYFNEREEVLSVAEKHSIVLQWKSKQVSDDFWKIGQHGFLIAQE